MSGDRYAPEPAAGRLGNRPRAFDSPGAQPVDDLRIVNDIADGRDRSGAFSRRFDDFERAPNPPAVAKLPGDDDPLARFSLWFGQITALDTRDGTGS